MIFLACVVRGKLSERHADCETIGSNHLLVYGSFQGNKVPDPTSAQNNDSQKRLKRSSQTADVTTRKLWGNEAEGGNLRKWKLDPYSQIYILLCSVLNHSLTTKATKKSNCDLITRTNVESK